MTGGDTNRLLSEGTEQIREVSNIYVHPGYKRATLDHDIAVMVLSQPFQLNGNVAKIKILKGDSVSSHSGKDCIFVLNF